MERVMKEKETSRFEEDISRFYDFLINVKHVTKNTADSYQRDLQKMKQYFISVGVMNPDQITATGMNTYILWLEKNGCAPSTVSRSIAAMKSFFHYLLQMGGIRQDPAMLLKNPVLEKKAPKVLTAEQMTRLLSVPSGDSNKEIRDKAMLELMYATGLKVSELVGLSVDSLNMQTGFVLVGKDQARERILPFGDNVKRAMYRYLTEVRGKLLKDEQNEVLFLNLNGGSMSRQGLWKMIKNYGRISGIEEEITPQMLRHTFAKHLMEQGGNQEALRERMGYATLNATQNYLAVKRK